MNTTFRATPCPCGNSSCKNWFVDPVAAFQGVSFTEIQAKAVADFMNRVDWEQSISEEDISMFAYPTRRST